MIKRFLQAVLHREERPFNETYTKTSNRCRAFVLKQSGAPLYEDLKQELEACNVRLVRELRPSTPQQKKGVEWIKLFVEICDWFHYQVVRVFVLACKLGNSLTISLECSEVYVGFPRSSIRSGSQGGS